MTKVTIISGFLGAGKTTLIKKLLKEAFAGEKCVLLENEYGEVGIDGGFMKDSGIEITELNSGCICCTLAGDFVQAIGEITERFNPDRLIIEPTGVGKLSDIRRVVEDAAKTLPIELAGACTVVDAAKCKMYLKNFGEFFIDQVKCAETVILSRTQLVSEEKLAAALELVRAQNADARIILTPWDEISGKIIIDAVEHPAQLIDINSICPPHEHDDDDDDDDEDEHEHHHHHHHEHDEHEHHHDDEDDDDDDDDDKHEHHHHHHEHDEHGEDDDEHEHHHEHHYDANGVCSCGHHHHHHHHHHDGEHDADEVFDNVGFETAIRIDKSALEGIMKALDDEEKYGTVLRMKGILPTHEGSWVHFDYTPGEIDIRDGSADYIGRVCVIGVKLNADALKELLGL